MKVLGLKELEKQLQEFEPKVVKKVLRSAMGKAFRPVLRLAKAKAPKDTGLLKRRIKMVAGVKADGTAVAGLYVSNTPEGPKGNEARNWVWYEKGIPSRGIAAQPFFRASLDNNEALVVSILQTTLKRGIEDALATKAAYFEVPTSQF